MAVSGHAARHSGHANLVLGYLQCVSCVVVFVTIALINFPSRQHVMWQGSEGLPYHEVLRKAVSSPVWFLKVVVRTPYYALTDWQLVFYSLLFIAAVLGATNDTLGKRRCSVRPMTY